MHSNYGWQESKFRANDIDTYPEPARSYCRDIKRAFEALVSRESDTLRGTGLSSLSADISFCLIAPIYDSVVIRVSVPALRATQYRTFRIYSTGKADIPDFIQAKIAEGTYNASTISPYDLMADGLVYTVSGFSDSKSLSELAKAEIRGKREGITAVVENHKGAFTNRHPYGALRMLVDAGAIEIELNKKSYSSMFYGFTRLIQKEVSLEQVREIEQQARFAHGFTTNIEGEREFNLIVSMSKSGHSYSSFVHLDVMLTPFLKYVEPAQQVTLKILPTDKSHSGLLAQLLEHLHSNLHSHLVFEIIKQDNRIFYQLTCDAADQQFIESQLQRLFPEFEVITQDAPLQVETPFSVRTFAPSGGYASFKEAKDFQLDPYVHLLRLLDSLDYSETVSLQVVFRPFHHLNLLEKSLDWFRTVEARRLKAINQTLPSSMTSAIGSRSREVSNKHPAWLTSVRLYATKPEMLDTLARDFLSQYNQPDKSWTQYGDDQSQSSLQYHAEEWPKGATTPPYNLLGTDELIALAHFPLDDLQSERLETVSMKSALPPELFSSGEVQLGTSTVHSITQPVTLPDSVRDRHLYIVGKTRSGKSTLIFNIVRQDIARGEGVAVIDPHGDLVQDLLNHIPESRIEDAIYFDAGDRSHPIALNAFSAQSEDEIGLLADDLLVTFRRLSESWGERMENILRHTFHTLLRVQGSTFVDIQTILQNPDFRAQAVREANNPLLTDFWQQQFPQLPRDATQPILNRMSKFVLSPALYSSLSQPDSNLNFYDVIQNKKILLVNLAQGRIGDDNAKLLGSLIVSQLQLAVMRRAALPKEAREPYYLFVDEFQNFTTSAFEKILSEAGKYKLSLTLAHQYISQLSDQMRSAILGNVGTMIMFPLGLQDANYLRADLGRFEPTDLTNLSVQAHEALCKPATQSSDTFKFNTLPPPQESYGHAQAVIAYTRETYCSESAEKAATSAEEVAEQPTSTEKAATSLPRATKRPVASLPKTFASAAEKVLHFVEQAGYLSIPQIIQLCYSHVAESARAPVASRDLKALVEAKRLKVQAFGRGKIYFTGRTPNPTNHNLAVRDLYTKIVGSGFELGGVNFFPQRGALTPDLAVSFVADDGSLIETFWEYDTGTEGIAELMKKVERYAPYQSESLVTFICSTPERMAQIRRSLKAEFLRFAVLGEFTTLQDAVFWQGQSDEAEPFFHSDEK